MKIGYHEKNFKSKVRDESCSPNGNEWSKLMGDLEETFEI